MSALMPDQQPSPNVAEFFSPGPGERLRAARLSMGFDLAKIASELHLTSAVVERLEADDYPAVGARVFVRGYLRNYARIVEMPVESILRQFDEKWPDETPTHSMLRESPRLPADGGPSRGVAGAMSWFLVIGALVLFVIWWRGYLDDIVPEQIRSGTLQEPALDGDTVDSEQPAFSDIQPADAIAPDGSLRLPSLTDAPASSIPTSSQVIRRPPISRRAPRWKRRYWRRLSQPEQPAQRLGVVRIRRAAGPAEHHDTNGTHRRDAGGGSNDG